MSGLSSVNVSMHTSPASLLSFLSTSSLSFMMIMCHFKLRNMFILQFLFSWVILLKTGQNSDIEGKNSECDFLLLLFGTESFTSPKSINIRHKLTGLQELGCLGIVLRHRSVSHV